MKDSSFAFAQLVSSYEVKKLKKLSQMTERSDP